MKFLLRVAFWLSLAVMLLPATPPPEQSQPARLSAAQALAAAGSAMSDMRQFCARRPDACTTGSQVLTLLAEKAQNGLRIVGEFVGGKLEGKSDAASDRATPGLAMKSEHDTLSPADLAPTWRDPRARTPRPAKHPA
jgi:hypothetical protein